MAIRSIITAPSPRLKIKCEPFKCVDGEVRDLLQDMLDTMYAAPGIGLASIQIGVPKRAIVVNLGPEVQPGGPLCMVNPEIIWMSDDIMGREEGCLSLPEQYSEVIRPSDIKVQYLDRDNNKQQIYASDMLSTCIQHEIDHLNGVLFVDHLSSVKRSMIIRKLSKARKQSKYEVI